MQGVLSESGDLITPIRKEIISADQIYGELAEIVSGRKIRRESDDEITCFKSVGPAIADSAAAKLAYRRAAELGVGLEVNLR